MKKIIKLQLTIIALLTTCLTGQDTRTSRLSNIGKGVFHVTAMTLFVAQVSFLAQYFASNDSNCYNNQALAAATSIGTAALGYYSVKGLFKAILPPLPTPQTAQIQPYNATPTRNIRNLEVNTIVVHPAPQPPSYTSSLRSNPPSYSHLPEE